LKITAEPRSDQWNADDFIGGSRTFAIAGVKDGTAEQKYDIALEGETRAWRPPLGMIRVLMQAWGDESKVWVGRRVTLYRDPTIRFGSDVLGGIRISHLSHIDKPMNFKVTTTRGKRATYTVQPIPDAAPVATRDFLEEAGKLSDVAALRALWKEAQSGGADPSTLAKIQALATPAPVPDES